MKNHIIVISFCFFLSLYGYAVVFFRKKGTSKQQKIVSIIYSSIFLSVGLWLTANSLFPKIEWTRTDDQKYTMSSNMYQKAEFIVLEESLYDLFLEQDDKLVEMYSDKNQRCEKEKTTKEKARENLKLLTKLNEVTDFKYGVLVVTTTKNTEIYLISNITGLSVADYSYNITNNTGVKHQK